ncbi:MAG: 4Fe-4S binding protein [Erysipelotrichaceae bacterium]|nr:4Fe-4S binding protein [Erysipelotrichaceae bacterium]
MPATVNKDLCIGCGTCEGVCPASAAKVVDGVSTVDEGACIDCGACQGSCPQGAITVE